MGNGIDPLWHLPHFMRGVLSVFKAPTHHSHSPSNPSPTTPSLYFSPHSLLDVILYMLHYFSYHSYEKERKKVEPGNYELLALMTEKDSAIELLCDEDLFVSSRSPSPSATRRDIQFRSLDKNQKLSEEESREAFSYFLSKEQQFAPDSEYLQQLQCSTKLSRARFKAIRYIILVCSKLSLAVGTVFNAANYVDRFLSMNSYMNWEGWMVELLSVACVSIAAKFDEVNVPSLHDLQTEEMEHRFQASTTQDMEIMILKSLDWRLSCVTPFSYFDLLLPVLLSRQRTEVTTSADSVTHLLLSLLGTTLLLQFRPFVISASAFRCALQDDDDASFSDLSHLIPSEHMVKLEECYEITKQIWEKKKKKKKKNEWSPVSVIPVHNGDYALGWNLRISHCLFTEPIPEDL